jgi:hypothetical protein
MGAWTGLIGSGEEKVAGCCECGNELAGFMKRGEFFD